VHSNVVVEARESGRLGEGDSLITNRPGLWLGVRTADCYPVILADAENRAVAVVHAGWRGAAGEIVLRTLDAMRAQYGTRSEHVVAAIGPGIGGCCYEVGPEVAARFERWARVSNGKLDLTQVLVAQVRSAGLLHSQVDQAGLCTFCDAVQFHSYRRDGEIAGRMVAAAAMR
jgi:YfiH family protein